MPQVPLESMPNIFPFSIELVVRFLLVFARVGSIVIFLPLFGAQSVPMMVRAGLAGLVSILLFPTLPPATIDLSMSTLQYVTLLAGELMIGIIIGYLVRLVFSAVQIAGAVAGFQIGFGIVNVMDPTTNSQVSITSQFLNVFAMLVFLAINAHHWFLQSVGASYLAIPPLGFAYTGGLLERIIRISSDMMVISVQIGAPVIVSMLFVSVGLGLVARTVPQMNVFIVGFPLNISLGLTMFGLTMPYFYTILRYMFETTSAQVLSMLPLMTHAPVAGMVQ